MFQALTLCFVARDSAAQFQAEAEKYKRKLDQANEKIAALQVCCWGKC